MKDIPRITYYVKLLRFCMENPEVSCRELMNLILDCLIEEASVPKKLANFTLVNDLKALAFALCDEGEACFVGNLNEIMLGNLSQIHSEIYR